jgi:cobalt-zinc-cadmium efflux system outer membrane protein
MRVVRTALALASVLVLPAREVHAQGALNLAEVLARARAQAPRIVSVRLALDEARGRLTGASIRQTSNPELDFAVGSRHGEGDARWTDFDLGVGQRFEPGRRSARIAGAQAVVDQATAAVDATVREVLRETAAAFHRAVYAGERLRLLTASEAIARSIADAAERRHRAGDIPVLDVNLARAALARARAEREGGEAAQAEALGALRVLLGIEGPIAVDGRITLGAGPDAAALAVSADERPEVRALEAAIREAGADIDLGNAQGRPEYGLGARYQREGGDNVVLGGLTLTLPVFAKGQELVATGTARRARLQADLAATRARIRIELDTALAAYARRAAAARLLETDALPLLDENDALTTRSFDVGQIGIADVLLIRREMLETRFDYLTTLLEAALARVEVDAAAAVLR